MPRDNCNDKGICRQTYFNYGSYLRARGNDKQLCELISAIENGSIIPYFVTHGGTIQGDVLITGNLTVGQDLVIHGDVIYDGDVTFGNGCGDSLTFKGTPNFECPGTFEAGLTVIGASDALVVRNGMTRLEDELDVGGAVSMGDTLGVLGKTTLVTTEVTGDGVLGAAALKISGGAHDLDPGYIYAVSAGEHIRTDKTVFATSLFAVDADLRSPLPGISGITLKINGGSGSAVAPAAIDALGDVYINGDVEIDGTLTPHTISGADIDSASITASTMTTSALTACSIESTPIGLSSPGHGAFTALSAGSPVTISLLHALTLNGGAGTAPAGALAINASGDVYVGGDLTITGAFSPGTIAGTTITGATIETSTIDSSPVGSGTQSTGQFTSLAATLPAGIALTLNGGGGAPVPSAIGALGDVYIDGDGTFTGLLTVGSFSPGAITGATITGATINSSSIGLTTPARGAFSGGIAHALTLNGGSGVVLPGQAIDASGDVYIDGDGTFTGTLTVGSFSPATITGPTITGATINTSIIDSTTIGVTTQSTGQFTSLAATLPAGIALTLNGGGGAPVPSAIDASGDVYIDGDGTFTGLLTVGSFSPGTIAGTTITGATIETSTINSSSIGATIQSTGQFTSLAATLPGGMALTLNGGGGAPVPSAIDALGDVYVDGDGTFTGLLTVGSFSTGTISGTTITGAIIDTSTIDSTTIGVTTQSTGQFTSLAATLPAGIALTLNGGGGAPVPSAIGALGDVYVDGDGTFTGLLTVGSFSPGTVAGATITGATIETSTIDSTTIGVTTQSTGQFTSLEATLPGGIALTLNGGGGAPVPSAIDALGNVYVNGNVTATGSGNFTTSLAAGGLGVVPHILSVTGTTHLAGTTHVVGNTEVSGHMRTDVGGPLECSFGVDGTFRLATNTPLGGVAAAITPISAVQSSLDVDGNDVSAGMVSINAAGGAMGFINVLNKANMRSNGRHKIAVFFLAPIVIRGWGSGFAWIVASGGGSVLVGTELDLSLGAGERCMFELEEWGTTTIVRFYKIA